MVGGWFDGGWFQHSRDESMGAVSYHRRPKMTAFVMSDYVRECESVTQLWRSISVGRHNVAHHALSAFAMNVMTTTLGFCPCFPSL